ncbi:MAG: D-alanyl-D-alanine carboxypeptidase [bacterium]|nr:D-alanyl-D-alanine carboxypeptidase [bacterium]
MMKRFLILLLSLFCLAISVNYCESAFAEEENLSSAKAYCVCEVKSGRILYEKNGDLKLPEASLTKIITAIVAIENNPDLEKVVEISKEAVGVPGSSIYLNKGEKLKIIDLLYGLMLRSGNDSAVALSIATSGSVEKFIELCNDFCERIGATNTHLVTPHGLHDDDHFTTANDLAKITSYALSNPVFRTIVGTKQITIPNTVKGENRLLVNKNKLLKKMPDSTGVKTGFTSQAGRCFVGSAKRGEMEIVCVLLNCNPMFEDCEKLLEKGFSEFEMVDLIEPYLTKEVALNNSEEKYLKVYSRRGLSYPLKNEEKTNVNIEIDLPNSLTAPLKRNQVVGEIRVSLAKKLIFSENLYSIKEVEANDYFSNIQKILEGLV